MMSCDNREQLTDRSHPGKRYGFRAVQTALICLCLLIVIAVFGSATLLEILDKDELLPLSTLDGIAVDSQGRLYCGLPDRSRICVYSSNGHFEKALHMPVRPFRFYIDSQDRVHTQAAGWIRVFSLDGKLLEEREVRRMDDIRAQFFDRDRTTATDSDGNVYSVGPYPRFRPEVIKRTPAGESYTIVSDPWYLWVLSFHMIWFWGMLVVIACLGVQQVIRMIRKRRSRRDPVNDLIAESG